ncbi:unnamed protein product [Bemisia tabaci]|uniref:Ribosomal protein L27 n=1 Tax=Bemisia tabaci TaxID=7038 RepID=A0A9P0AHD7_BEMTA|nr:unnamed protein product [Bemisia tabaci]
MFPSLSAISSFAKSFFSHPFAKDIIARGKKKKASSCTRNGNPHVINKRRGPKVYANTYVRAGSVLFLQRKLRIHPGLNVAMGKNLTIFALKPGKVVWSTEKFDPDYNRQYIEQWYGHRKNDTILKKYMHIIPEPQHNDFKLVHLI